MIWGSKWLLENTFSSMLVLIKRQLRAQLLALP